MLQPQNNDVWIYTRFNNDIHIFLLINYDESLDEWIGLRLYPKTEYGFLQHMHLSLGKDIYGTWSKANENNS